MKQIQTPKAKLTTPKKPQNFQKTTSLTMCLFLGSMCFILPVKHEATQGPFRALQKALEETLRLFWTPGSPDLRVLHLGSKSWGAPCRDFCLK